MPSDLAKAGNVVYKELKYKMSLRTAPTHDCDVLVEQLKKAFEEAPESVTYNAKVTFDNIEKGNGFCAPDLPADIKAAVYKSTQQVFEGRDPIFVGCGGSIPFMEVFSQEFPNANFLLTGCATMTGNAHCANENIDLEYCKKFITAISLTLSNI